MKYPRILKVNAIRNSGALLIELAVAIAIFAIAITGALAGAASAQESVLSTSLYRQSIYLSQKLLEYSTATLTATSSTVGSVIATSSTEYYTPCIANVIASSSYSSTLSQFIADEKVMSARNGDCGGYPSPKADWSNYGEIFRLDTGSTTLFTLDVFNKLVAVGGEGLATTSPTLYLINTSQEIPEIVSSLIVGSINDLDFAGQYIYTAAQGTSSQFKVIDASDPSSIRLIAERTLPGVSGSFPSGLSIAYYNSKVYVGTHRTAGREFHIYDVANPNTPVWLGSIELNHNINDIAVREPYAYLATSGNVRHVIILDISTSTQIKQMATIALPGAEDALKAFLVGNSLYIGRKKSVLASVPNVFELDVTNPASTTIISTANYSKDITGIFKAGSTTHITTRSQAQDLDFEDDRVYLASSTSLVVVKPKNYDN